MIICFLPMGFEIGWLLIFPRPSFVVTTRDGLEVKCRDLDDLCWKTTEERTHEGVSGLSREGVYYALCI